MKFFYFSLKDYRKAIQAFETAYQKNENIPKSLKVSYQDFHFQIKKK